MDERAQVYELVLHFFDGDRTKADLWMRAPNLLLGGMSPGRMIYVRPGKVLKWVRERPEDPTKRGP
jgi:hypothetical protein